MTNHLSQITARQSNLALENRLRFSAQCLRFEEMSNLMLDPVLTHFGPTIDVESDSKIPNVLLMARLFNDFDASMHLILQGLGERAYHPMRDSLETMLLLRLFGLDPQLALRWMKDLNEYHASTVLKTLKDRHAVELPLEQLHHMLSRMGHPNFVAGVHVVEEIEKENKTFQRTYHFGGYENNGFTKQQLQLLLCLQWVAIGVVLPSFYKSFHPEFEHWWSRVLELPDLLRTELGLDIEVTFDPGPDRRSRQISVRMGFPVFDKDRMRDS